MAGATTDRLCAMTSGSPSVLRNRSSDAVAGATAAFVMDRGQWRASGRFEQCAPPVAGTSRVGLRSKKPTGLRVNPA
jgi:hypothetical protein